MSEEKILIIEDDADVRLGLQVLLNANQYQTFFAANAVEALVEGATNAPDLIILDLGLPAIDGFDVLRHFGDLFLFRVPVIVVSARELEGNRKKALEAGAKAYLQKPWNDEELLETIRQHLAAAELVELRIG
jgi:two-component system KDP operon response regulator KdpE